MKRSSLQLRLFGAAATAVIVGLALAGLGILALFEQQAERLVAVDLRHTVKLLVGQVRILPDGSLSVPEPPSDPRFAQVHSGLYWQIADRGGVRLRSRSQWDESLPLKFDEQNHTSDHVFTTRGPGARPVLVAERWIEIASAKGIVPLQIAVASDTDAVHDGLRAFAGPLAASLAILAAALVLAAWVFVRSGLNPFRRLRTDLAAVHEGRSTRLSGVYPDEVRPLISDLNELLRRQEEIAAKSSARAADLAHGLKTPLAVLDALAADVREAGKGEIADEIGAEVAMMKGHIERELARARSGMARPLVIQRTPILSIVERLTSALGKIAGRSELRFEVACGPDLVFLGGENDLLEMLGNILDNARKWGRSLVRVTGTRCPGALCLTIEDDGPGLPRGFGSDDIARALRLDESRAGTGFGLAIAKDVAEANGGTLGLGRSDLGGLKVTLRFAVHDDGA